MSHRGASPAKSNQTCRRPLAERRPRRAARAIGVWCAIGAACGVGILSGVSGARAQGEPAAAPTPDPGAGAANPAEYFTRLVAALRGDESYKVRLQAAVFLGRTKDARALEPLTEALRNDEHYTVRAAAAMALANLSIAEGVSEILHAGATDGDEFVRQEAARALRKFDVDTALPYVVAAYGSEDARVRAEAVRYLAAGDLEAAEVVLSRALGDEPEILSLAQGAIARMSEEDRIRFLEDAVEHRDPAVRRGAVEVLRQVPSKVATDIVLKVCERDVEDEQVRDAARRALRDMRAFIPLPRILQDATTNPDKYVRARSLKLLGVIGGPEAQRALLATLADNEIYIRGTAVLALRELGQPATIPELEKLLRDPSNQRIAPYIRNAVRHLRRKPEATN